MRYNHKAIHYIIACPLIKKDDVFVLHNYDLPIWSSCLAMHRTEQRTPSNQPWGYQQRQQCRQDNSSITLFPPLCRFYHVEFTCSLVSIALQCLAAWCGSPPSLVHSIPCAVSSLGNSREACATAAALTTPSFLFLLVFLEFSLYDFYKAPLGLSASGSQLVTQFLVKNKFLLLLVWIVHFCCFGCFHWLVMLSLQCMLLL